MAIARSLEQKIMDEKVAELQKEIDDHIVRQAAFKEKSGIDPFVTINSPGTLTGTAQWTSVDAEREHREWLDQTQPMRVVALDEAIKYVTAVIETTPSAILDYRDILNAAQAFAKFLNEGKVK